MAEARKGKIYEYFLYKPFNISVVTNETVPVKIEINKTDQYNETGYAKNYLFIGKIADPGNFIKLYVTHKDPLEENFIYASQSDSFKESTNLYRDNDYKTIDRENALIIPMDKINKDNLLYIRIPCKDICTYDFHYLIYSESIEINDNQCFDINLEDIGSYKFTYKIGKTKK